ncbi:MAG: FliM/FliN family flagellar motor C-terminal domain-containing protein [Erythrobacter sp.]
MRMGDIGRAAISVQHCSELVARGPRPEEHEALITEWRRELARELNETLGALFAGDRLVAEVRAPERLPGSDVIARIGPVAANSLLRCGMGEGASVLLSLDHATALALAERAFGGAGRIGDPSDASLPRSAQLLCDEIAALIAGALVRVRHGDAADPALSAAACGEVMIRSENAARLRAFEPAADCALFTLRLSDSRGLAWHLSLAVARAQLDDLLPSLPANRRAGQAVAEQDAAASLGAIPLPLCAVLAEFDLTLAQLDGLAPGDSFPLAMPRTVPLRTGATLVAQGSIGTLDDRLALRLSHVPHQGTAS